MFICSQLLFSWWGPVCCDNLQVGISIRTDTWVLLVPLLREWTVRPNSSDILGLLHLDQNWFLLHLKYHFQFYFVLVLELLSQACLKLLTSPLLLKQEDGVFSLPVLKLGQTVP